MKALLPDGDFGSLSLEPTEGQAQAPSTPSSGRARFNIDLRTGTDRRRRGERRQELRFQADRRSGADRRPRKAWEPGSNL